MTRCQRFKIVRPQHSLLIGQHRPEILNGFLNPPRIPQRHSEMKTYHQHIRMIRTQQPRIALSQQTILRNSLDYLIVSTKRCSQVASSCKHIFMIKAKLFFRTTEKITTRINRHTCAFIAHQCHNSKEAYREKFMCHRINLRHTLTFIT